MDRSDASVPVPIPTSPPLHPVGDNIHPSFRRMNSISSGAQSESLNPSTTRSVLSMISHRGDAVSELTIENLGDSQNSSFQGHNSSEESNSKVSSPVYVGSMPLSPGSRVLSPVGNNASNNINSIPSMSPSLTSTLTKSFSQREGKRSILSSLSSTSSKSEWSKDKALQFSPKLGALNSNLPVLSTISNTDAPSSSHVLSSVAGVETSINTSLYDNSILNIQNNPMPQSRSLGGVGVPAPEFRKTSVVSVVDSNLIPVAPTLAPGSPLDIVLQANIRAKGKRKIHKPKQLKRLQQGKDVFERKEMEKKLGKRIDKEHRLYHLSFGMMLGLYTSCVLAARASNIKFQTAPGEVVTTSQLPLQHGDFTQVRKLLFPPSGTLETPPHRLPGMFKFKDYAPEVFRRLRNRFGIDEKVYLGSLGGAYEFIEFASNSKSGSFFFYSHDGRFLIKTQSKEECKFLKSILPKYYKFVEQNPDTYLARFFGLHRIKMPHVRKKIHFVVMQSVFYGEAEVHAMFDLKGSTVGRSASAEEKARGYAHCVYKDNDMSEMGVKIKLGRHRREMFLSQLTKDVSFLESLGIMDYSLLLGIHKRTNEPLEPHWLTQSHSTRKGTNIGYLSVTPSTMAAAGAAAGTAAAESAVGRPDGNGIAFPYSHSSSGSSNANDQSSEASVDLSHNSHKSFRGPAGTGLATDAISERGDEDGDSYDDHTEEESHGYGSDVSHKHFPSVGSGIGSSGSAVPPHLPDQTPNLYISHATTTIDVVTSEHGSGDTKNMRRKDIDGRNESLVGHIRATSTASYMTEEDKRKSNLFFLQSENSMRDDIDKVTGLSELNQLPVHTVSLFDDDQSRNPNYVPFGSRSQDSFIESNSREQVRVVIQTDINSDFNDIPSVNTYNLSMSPNLDSVQHRKTKSHFEPMIPSIQIEDTHSRELDPHPIEDRGDLFSGAPPPFPNLPLDTTSSLQSSGSSRSTASPVTYRVDRSSLPSAAQMASRAVVDVPSSHNTGGFACVPSFDKAPTSKEEFPILPSLASFVNDPLAQGPVPGPEPPHGAVQGRYSDGSEANELYFIGIIDILQRYDLRKFGETVIKSVVYDRKQISAVSPSLYAKRFVEFMRDHSE